MGAGNETERNQMTTNFGAEQLWGRTGFERAIKGSIFDTLNWRFLLTSKRMLIAVG